MSTTDTTKSDVPVPMAWYRLPSGKWVHAPADDPRWANGPTRTHRKRNEKTS